MRVVQPVRSIMDDTANQGYVGYFTQVGQRESRLKTGERRMQRRLQWRASESEGRTQVVSFRFRAHDSPRPCPLIALLSAGALTSSRLSHNDVHEHASQCVHHNGSVRRLNQAIECDRASTQAHDRPFGARTKTRRRLAPSRSGSSPLCAATICG